MSGKDYFLYATTNVVIVYVNSPSGLFGSQEANEKAIQTLLDEKGSEWDAITIKKRNIMQAEITLHIRPIL